MFKIYDGREYFYQWDLDRKLIVYDETIKEVHFWNKTDDCSLVCEVYTEGNLRLVNVPNILLQDNWRINAYGYDGSYTKYSDRFDVKSRAKPADYVYTETEIKRWESYEERLAALEEGGSAQALYIHYTRQGSWVDECCDCVADLTYEEITKAYEEGQIIKAVFNDGGSITVLPLTYLSSTGIFCFSVLNAETQFAIQHKSNNAPTMRATELASLKGVPYAMEAKVGQVLVVGSVDKDGTPVDWMAVDLPTGDGGEGGAEVYYVDIEDDGNGQTFSPNRTTNEVGAAYFTGLDIKARIELDGMMLIVPMCAYQGNTVVYGGATDNQTISIVHTGTQATVSVKELALKEEADIYYVDMTPISETEAKPNKSFAEVLTAYLNGLDVRARLQGAIIPLGMNLQNQQFVYAATGGIYSYVITQNRSDDVVQFSITEMADRQYVDDAIANLPTGGENVEGWEFISDITITAEDEVWRLVIDKKDDGSPFAYNELCLFTEKMAGSATSLARIFTNQASPYQGIYCATVNNYFVTNAQSGGVTCVKNMGSNGHIPWFEVMSSRGVGIGRNRLDYDNTTLRSFGIQTSGETVYMSGRFILYGR